MNCDICIIGAGAAGLVVAATAAQLGCKVVLIEANKMGGDCLNYGCVPSKSLLAAAKAADHGALAKQLGVELQHVVNFPQVYSHIQQTISKLEQHDSVERFTNLGVRVIHGTASFIATNKLQVNDRVISAKRFVVATGSRPKIPNLPGLDKVGYYTNETIFTLSSLPQHLIIIGGGIIACELGQAYAALGAKVTILQRSKLLASEDKQLVAILKEQLKSQINLIEHADILSVAQKSSDITVNYNLNSGSQSIKGSHLLLATGREINHEALNLDLAKVKHDATGIKVNRHLVTSNKKIYAIGDVIGGKQFTHAAGHQAGIVIKHLLFRIPAKYAVINIPRVIYTSPEYAHVGYYEHELQAKNLKYTKVEQAMQDVDRAQTELQTVGNIKLLVNRGKVLGVTIVAEHAGELIVPWLFAIQGKLSLADIMQVTLPYPTYSDIHKKLLSKYYAPSFLSAKVKLLVRLLKVFW